MVEVRCSGDIVGGVVVLVLIHPDHAQPVGCVCCSRWLFVVVVHLHIDMVFHLPGGP